MIRRASLFCFFFSSCSSACSFSLACCFFSMSVRRFCAVEDELWDNVPSRAPNSLCPRLRSSNCPLLRRSDALSRGEAGEFLLSLDWPLSSLSLLLRSSEKEDWRRFNVGDVDKGRSVVSSGSMTAEATALKDSFSTSFDGRPCFTYSGSSPMLGSFIK